METNLQNGNFLKLSQIYLNNKDTKNQLEVQTDKANGFSVASKSLAINVSNIPVNLNPSKIISQSIFQEEISVNQVYNPINQFTKKINRSLRNTELFLEKSFVCSCTIAGRIIQRQLIKSVFLQRWNILDLYHYTSLVA